MIDYESALYEAQQFLNNSYDNPGKENSEVRIFAAIFKCAVFFPLIVMAAMKGYAEIAQLMTIIWLIFCGWQIVKMIQFSVGKTSNLQKKMNLTAFEHQKFIPHMIKELYPNAAMKNGLSRELSVKSGQANLTKYYTDFGTWNYRTEHGVDTLFTEIWLHDGMDVIDKQGVLFCFKNVLAEPIRFPVYILCNKEQYDAELRRRLGIPKDSDGGMYNALDSVLKGNSIIKHRLAKDDAAFNHYYHAYCQEKQFGEEYLDASLRNQLIELHNYYPNMWFGISYVHTDIFIYIHGVLNTIVGRVDEPIIREDLFERFYRMFAEGDTILNYVRK